MNEISNPVDQELQELALDDATLETPGMSLEEALAAETPEQQELQDETPPKKEPGWIKKRVESAVQKQLAESEARIRAEYEAKMAPLQAVMFEREADQLVADGEFKSRERALEYVRLKNGAPQPSSQPTGQKDEQQQSARDEQGRFTTPKTAQVPPDVEARAKELYAQAEAIKVASGVDVLEIFNQDPEVKKRVSTGEWSFLDVYQAVTGQHKPRVPSPTRSANSGSLDDIDLTRMSKAQFAKLDDTISGGGVINFMK